MSKNKLKMTPLEAQEQYNLEWKKLNDLKLSTTDPTRLKRIRQALSAISVEYNERFKLSDHYEESSNLDGDWFEASDIKRLTRRLDVALNGEANAAKQASLCDIVSQVESENRKLNTETLPVLWQVRIYYDEFTTTHGWSEWEVVTPRHVESFDERLKEYIDIIASGNMNYELRPLYTTKQSCCLSKM